jgi:hypothetical protein
MILSAAAVAPEPPSMLSSVILKYKLNQTIMHKNGLFAGAGGESTCRAVKGIQRTIK